MTDLNKTIILEGISGKRYVFNLYSMSTTFNSVKGIYTVGKLTENNSKHTLLYIGQTNDLSTRFTSHHKQTCFDRNLGNCIGVLLVPKQEDRDLIEKDLILKHKPTCNDLLT